MCSMEGIMKELGKYRAMIALLCFAATVFSGCGNRTEAVITDGEDITTVSAEYPTLEETIELIKKHGGIAILAHPGNNLKDKFELFDDMVFYVLDYPSMGFFEKE